MKAGRTKTRTSTETIVIKLFTNTWNPDLGQSTWTEPFNAKSLQHRGLIKDDTWEIPSQPQKKLVAKLSNLEESSKSAGVHKEKGINTNARWYRFNDKRSPNVRHIVTHRIIFRQNWVDFHRPLYPGKTTKFHIASICIRFLKIKPEIKLSNACVFFIGLVGCVRGLSGLLLLSIKLITRARCKVLQFSPTVKENE